MKPGKVCLSVLLAVWAFAAAHAEIYTARILCEKEIPACAAGAVITVTDEAYSAEADIPFTVEWILSSYDEDGKPAEGESAASPDMVITDDGRLYCADSDEISVD